VVTVIRKLTWIFLISFAITRLFFHEVFFIFNTLLPTFIKTLYTSVVKFPASTLEHITSGTRKGNQRIRRVHSDRNMEDVLHLHGNARPHASLLTHEAIAKAGWTVLPHPVHSPDLILSDYHV
jgi:hypothetical protein